MQTQANRSDNGGESVSTSESCKWYSNRHEDNGTESDGELCFRCGERFEVPARYRGYYCSSCREYYKKNEAKRP